MNLTRRARQLAQELENTDIINGDALEALFFGRQGMQQTFVAVTEDDEVNILSALLAKEPGPTCGGAGEYSGLYSACWDARC